MPLGAVALIGCNALVNPQLAPSAAMHATLLLFITAVRLRVHRMLDQQSAHAIFSWVLAAAACLRCVAISYFQNRFGVVTDVSSVGIVCACLILSLMIVHFHVTMLPRPRMIALASLLLQTATQTRPFSVLSQKDESLLICAAVLLGVLLGHTLEDSLVHMATEAERIASLGQQASQQHSTVLQMLFPQV